MIHRSGRGPTLTSTSPSKGWNIKQTVTSEGTGLRCVVGDDPDAPASVTRPGVLLVPTGDFVQLGRNLDSRDEAERVHRGQAYDPSHAGAVIEKSVVAGVEGNRLHTLPEVPVAHRLYPTQFGLSPSRATERRSEDTIPNFQSR